MYYGVRFRRDSPEEMVSRSGVAMRPAEAPYQAVMGHVVCLPRKDFPEALIYTCADLILKRLADFEMVSGDSDTAVVALPISEIKQDETSYKFSTDFAVKTTATDNVGLLADLDFDSIKAKLNLYRKLVSF